MANNEEHKPTSNSGQTYSSMDRVGTQKDKLPTKKMSHGSNLDEPNQIKDNAKKMQDSAGLGPKSPNQGDLPVGKANHGLDRPVGNAPEALSRPIPNIPNKVPEPIKKPTNATIPKGSGVSRNGRDSNLEDVLAKRKNANPVADNNDAGINRGGGQQNVSLPSSDTNKNQNKPKSRRGLPGSSSRRRSESGGEGEEKSSSSVSNIFQMSRTAKIIVFGVLPIVAFFFFLLIALFQTTSVFSDFDDAFGMSMVAGEDTGNVDYVSSPEQKEFYERINKIKEEYQSQGKNLDTLKVVSVYRTITSSSVDYKKMDDEKIREIADLMFENNSYNEEKFKENLLNTYIPKYMPDTTPGQRQDLVNEVFDYIKRYYEFINKKTNSSTCASIGSCTYDIKGFYINGKGNVTKNIQVSDLYVQLMQCGVANGHNYGGTFGQPLAEEELVPFETYILGVAYQEIGDDAPEEAFKAQLIAARSYALARPTEMGGWRSLEQDSSGRWILKAASCTQDQVYCNPDKGCSSPISMQWGQVYSGTDKGVLGKNPLPQDSPLRRYAAETQGQVLVNSNGNIIYTDFNNDVQNSFKNNANSGLDYKQILLSHYSQATDIQQASCNDGTSSSGCVGGSTGEFSKWKQYEGEWADTVYVGSSGKTIHQIGCLATSVSMLVAKSGVPVNVDPLNPGTFVNYLNEHNGFSGGDFVWSSVSSVAPTFHFVDKVSVAGMTREQKLAKITELVNQPNTYVVAEVKGNTGQHWVAIDGVNGNNVIMMDPGSDSTDMWSQYNWNNTSTLAYFRVS